MVTRYEQEFYRDVAMIRIALETLVLHLTTPQIRNSDEGETDDNNSSPRSSDIINHETS